MFRQANTFALAFVFISVLLIADAQRIVGGYSKVLPDHYNELQMKLQNSNLQSALGGKSSCVRVVEIVSAEQQVVAGMNYRIIAVIDINGKSQKYCFLLFQSLPPVTVKVNCAAAMNGATCECFKNQ